MTPNAAEITSLMLIDIYIGHYGGGNKLRIN